MNIKDLRIDLQKIALELEKYEHLKSTINIPDPLLNNLFNIYRDLTGHQRK